MEYRTLRDKEKEEFIDKCFFVTCLADIFFLPYFWAITVPYSMPLVIFWFFKRFRIISKTRECSAFLLIAFLMLLSTIISFFLNPAHIYNNSTLLLEMLTVFIYYFMFAYYIDRHPVRMKPVLICFVLFVTAFAVVYNLDKSLYQQIKYIWNAQMGTVWTTNDFAGYRFGFFWMDENNIGYMTNAVVLYLICNEKTSLSTKVFLIGALTFIVISCMSTGSVLSFAVSLGLYVVFTIYRFFTGKITFRFKIVNVILFILLLVVLFFLIPIIPDYVNGTIAQESVARIQNNSASSRITIWMGILRNVNFPAYIFVGQGGLTFLNGAVISPHNGHFFWILAYGMLVYSIFMYIFFRKRSFTSVYQYLFTVPLWIGFTINIMLGELKLSAIWALLVALSSSRFYLESGRQQKETTK